MSSINLNELSDNLWYVYVNNVYDSTWTNRVQAREQKAKLKSYGASKITLSKSPISLGPLVVDKHS